jgi:trans-aconitate methyltransferase
MVTTSEHWNAAYAPGDEAVSWFQDRAAPSLSRILRVAGADDAVIDVGGGSSPLAAELLAAGLADVSVLDISDAALALGRSRSGVDAVRIEWIVADLLDWQPGRSYDLWHDRAVFHFLVTEEQREAYRRTLLAALACGGHVVIGVFADDGPEQCSGLPVRRHSERELADWLGAGFVVVETSRETHTTPGGREQSFVWVTARRVEDRPDD